MRLGFIKFMFDATVEIFIRAHIILTFTYTKFTKLRLMFISLKKSMAVFLEQECSYELGS